ncbi:hypothetical protein [Mesobacillus zeae]|uniref:hypothetical protein n=1 Tax=Mesobacillus zeae TaxID=1917180 RepID=UPI00300A4EE9
MLSEFYKICSIDQFEFGYYLRADGGCVDEHKVVVRYWDKNERYLAEKTLAYEDSPGEATEVIAHYLRIGIDLNNLGEYRFLGGYELKYREGQYVPVPMELDQV